MSVTTNASMSVHAAMKTATMMIAADTMDGAAEGIGAITMTGTTKPRRS
jgi:hypothetical protein